MSKVLTAGLIRGRHNLPVDKYIFDEVTDIFDFSSMSKQVHDAIKDYSDVQLYVTGLTPALIEVVNYCIIKNVNLTLFHYDMKTDKFVPQIVDTNFWAPMLREGGYI